MVEDGFRGCLGGVMAEEIGLEVYMHWVRGLAGLHI